MASYAFRNLARTNHLGLPRLPVPALEETLERYLASVKPLLSGDSKQDKAFAAHAQLVQNFGNSDGVMLHRMLTQRDEDHAAADAYPFSYIEKDWDDMYLELRCPNIVHVNPGYILKDGPAGTPVGETQASRAAAFVASSLRWLALARSGGAGVEGEPGLCFSQFPTQFGATRVPRVGRDEVRIAEPPPGHIVVQRGGKFFRVEVQDAEGRAARSADEIAASLQSIIDGVPAATEQPGGVGVLTSAERDTWAGHRAALEAHAPANAAALADIDSALMLVALDTAAPQSLAEQSQNVLHGLEASARAWEGWGGGAGRADCRDLSEG